MALSSFCKNILEQYSFIYFGYVKEKYIELLYEKKKKMTLKNLGRHNFPYPFFLFLTNLFDS